MTNTTDTESTLTRERSDLLESLAEARYFLRATTSDLTDEQARRRTTISELTLGGLIKHVSNTEAQWAAFVVDGPSAMGSDKPVEEWGEAEWTARANDFVLLPDETLAGVLADYEAVAARTDELVRTMDLDADHPLPEAPWFTPGATRSTRSSLVHIVAETTQHSGHADIIREALDGKKSMG